MINIQDAPIQIANDLTQTQPGKALDARQGEMLDAKISAMGNLQGTNYLMVYGVGTPTENAAELQAAYDIAKTMPRYWGTLIFDNNYIVSKGATFFCDDIGGYLLVTSDITDTDVLSANQDKMLVITEAQAKSVRTTVIVVPGEYTSGTPFNVDTEGIDIVSLTGNEDVLLDGINVTANVVFIKGIDCGDNAFNVDNSLDLLICDTCKGGDYSFSAQDLAGTYNICTGRAYSFSAMDWSANISHCSIGSGGLSCAGAIGFIQYCKSVDTLFPSVPGARITYCINGDGSAATNF